MKLQILIVALLFSIGFCSTACAQNTNQEIVKTIKPFTATVIKIGNTYLLVPVNNENQRYAPTNLDEQYHTEGLRVIVMGNELAPPPGVRLMGTPFQITNVRLAGEIDRSAGANANKPAKPGDKNVDKGASVGVKSSPVKDKKGTKLKDKVPTKAGASVGVKSSPANAGTGTKTKFKWVSKAENVRGTVRKVGGKYLIETAKTRYMPVNLAVDYQRDGLQVLFSGDVGEIPKNVRLPGTPLKVSSIKMFKKKKKNIFRR